MLTSLLRRTSVAEICLSSLMSREVYRIFLVASFFSTSRIGSWKYSSCSEGGDVITESLGSGSECYSRSFWEILGKNFDS